MINSIPLMDLGNDIDCSLAEDVAKAMDKTMDDMAIVNPQGIPPLEKMEMLCTNVLDNTQRIENLCPVLEL